jgi:hypothetical protein
LRDSFIIDTLKNSRQFSHRGGGFPSLESEIFRRCLATRFIDYIRWVLDLSCSGTVIVSDNVARSNAVVGADGRYRTASVQIRCRRTFG